MNTATVRSVINGESPIFSVLNGAKEMPIQTVLLNNPEHGSIFAISKLTTDPKASANLQNDSIFTIIGDIFERLYYIVSKLAKPPLFPCEGGGGSN